MTRFNKSALIAAALMLSVSAGAQINDAYVRVVHAVADAPMWTCTWTAPRPFRTRPSRP